MHAPSRLYSYSSRNHHIQFCMHYLDSHLHHVDTLPRSVKRECSIYIAMALMNKLYTPCSGVSYAPYAYGTIIRTIRVWLYHMRIRIRVWYRTAISYSFICCIMHAPACRTHANSKTSIQCLAIIFSYCM